MFEQFMRLDVDIIQYILIISSHCTVTTIPDKAGPKWSKNKWYKPWVEEVVKVKQQRSYTNIVGMNSKSFC